LATLGRADASALAEGVASHAARDLGPSGRDAMMQG